MGQVGILVVEVVYALGESQYAGVAVGSLEGCKLDASEEKTLNVHIVVLGHLLGYNLAHGIAYLLVVDVGVVLGESLLILARGLLSILVLLIVQDNVFNNSHFVVIWFVVYFSFYIL